VAQRAKEAVSGGTKGSLSGRREYIGKAQGGQITPEGLSSVDLWSQVLQIVGIPLLPNTLSTGLYVFITFGSSQTRRLPHAN